MTTTTTGLNQTKEQILERLLKEGNITVRELFELAAGEVRYVYLNIPTQQEYPPYPLYPSYPIIYGSGIEAPGFVPTVTIPECKS